MTSTDVSSTKRVLGAMSRKSATPATRHYRTGKPFAAVRFEYEQGGKGQIVFLPEGAELEAIGSSCLCGCLEVVWECRIYNMFQADLWGPGCSPIFSALVAPNPIASKRAALEPTPTRSMAVA